jgi:phosphoglycerate kinase
LLGGAKIDTKIGILESFLAIADVFLIGGALANTFLAAKGFEVGTSLCESDKIEVAKKFLDDAMAQNVKVLLPIDALVADEINKDVKAEVLPVDSVGEDMKILDIGPESSKHFIEEINNAKTIIWNGPMGLYELPQFLNGTKNIANAVAASDAVTVVGGGDSLDAIKAFGLKKDQFTHISTGGGAMLEFLEGKVIPALAPLFDA